MNFPQINEQLVLAEDKPQMFPPGCNYLLKVSELVQDELIKFIPKPGFTLSEDEEEFKGVIQDLHTILRHVSLVSWDAPGSKDRALLFINRGLSWENFIHEDPELEGTDKYLQPWRLGEMFYNKLDWVLDGSDVADEEVVLVLQRILPSFLNDFEDYLNNL